MKHPEIFVDTSVNQKMYSFEGIDGSGKSTGIQLVNRGLINQGIDSVVVSCPSNSIVGSFLRENLKKLEPWQRHSFFVMDMIDIIKKQNVKNPNSIILWDRYIDSNIVSNKDTSPEESAKWVACLPLPRKTFLYEIEPEIVIKQRAESVHNHSMDIEWQHLKHDRYLALAQQEPERIIIINATETRDIIAQKVMKVILDDLLTK